MLSKTLLYDICSNVLASLFSRHSTATGNSFIYQQLQNNNRINFNYDLLVMIKHWHYVSDLLFNISYSNT